jgi:cation diffusion facilitator CzcD-associated flavoprotein CzcO
VASEGGEFAVVLNTGEDLWATNMVVATGPTDAAHAPRDLSDLRYGDSSGLDLVSHTAEHRDLSRLAGRRVGVLGGDQSALESATLHPRGWARVGIAVAQRLG